MAVFRTRGQSVGLAPVERAVRHERPPHALLLVGPGHVGKTTLALDLAAGLLCLDADPAARPCGSCSACRKVDHGNHPDLHRLAPEGAGGQIRLAAVQTLVAELALLPLEGRFRVAIVEAAHRLNPDAQNALLKTLEEPPAGTTIVLCADDLSQLLPTLISRTARVRLGPVATTEVAAILGERLGIEPVQAHAIARLASGRPGDALLLARRPDATLAHGRLARTLLDLLAADRRTRLAAVTSIVEDGAVLAEGSPPEAVEVAPSDQTDAPSHTRDATERGDDVTTVASRTRASRSARPARASRPATVRRVSPMERRRAALSALHAWRVVARDLAVASRGGRAELQHIDLLEEIAEAAAEVDPAAVVRFLGRLDALASAVEAYANPELCLDVLVLAWPRRQATA